MRTTNIRFTGLASGLDTESMVKAMIMPNQMKVDSSIQQKKLLELKKDAYKDLSNKVNTFFTKYAGNARLEGTFNKFNATSSSSAVTINSATGASSNIIKNITQLASGAVLETKGIVPKPSKNTTLEDLGIKTTGGQTIELKVGEGEPVTVILTQDTTLGKLETQLKELMPDCNVSFDTTAGGFFISTKESGSAQKIKIEMNIVDETASPKETSVLDKLGLGTGTAEGKDAKFNFNGMDIESPTNTLTLNGVNFTLNEAVSGNVNITAKQDTDAIFEYIQEFVTEYNKLLEEMNTKIGAKPNRDYMPLTDEQKADMSEEDIKLWNAKIEESLLSGDPTLKKITSAMRSIMSGVVEGNGFGMLANIGIESANYKDKGILTIDENKLRQAIENNLEDVMGLFAGKDGEDGIVDRLYSELSDNFKSIAGVKSASSIFYDVTLESKIKQEDDKILKLQERLAKAEQLYYAKFTAMEKMLSQLNSQSSSLFSQLGGM